MNAIQERFVARHYVGIRGGARILLNSRMDHQPDDGMASRLRPRSVRPVNDGSLGDVVIDTAPIGGAGEMPRSPSKGSQGRGRPKKHRTEDAPPCEGLVSRVEELETAVSIMQSDRESITEMFDVLAGMDAPELLKKMKAFMEDHDNDGPRRTSSTETKKVWAWKNFANLGESIFNTLEEPWKNGEFRTFVVNGLDQLQGIPPLHGRFLAIKTSPGSKEAYKEFLRSMDEQRLPRNGSMEHHVLRELISLFLVATDEMGYLPLSVFLNVTRKSRVQARVYPEESFRGDSHSLISTYIRESVKTAAWYLNLNLPLPDDLATGEGVKSEQHYRKEILKLREAAQGWHPASAARRPATF